MRRLKVLLSAYACEPGKGSEPEVGWQTAVHLAKHHDVTVLTRANNRGNIDAALRELSGSVPHFEYYDPPPWLLGLKRAGLPVSVFYLCWQIGARLHARKILSSFDAIQHVTFNSFRQPGFWWFTGRPVVLGPLGGGQCTPLRMLPRGSAKVFAEFLRSVSVKLWYVFFPIWISFLSASKILVANKDTLRRLPARFREKSVEMLETAILPESIRDEAHEAAPSGAVRFLWAGRLDRLKACDLAIAAFAEVSKTHPEATLTIVGSGPEEAAFKRHVQSLGIARAVSWLGHVPKAQMPHTVSRHDVFLFTSLRDTSGNVLLEAMAAGIAAVALDHQGVKSIATAETALLVPVVDRKTTIGLFASAMARLVEDRMLIAALGNAGRARIMAEFTWPRHAERLAAVIATTR